MRILLHYIPLAILASGVVVILASFLFIFPYIGYHVNKQYAHVTAPLVSVTGLDLKEHYKFISFCNSIFRWGRTTY
jgi:hypothetical protein